ncbi:unnamed protein product [Thelazia callipaeda]|uniref:PLD phosphodiesterase domain-containing protein n=1 Tax=Thelazia callipaeda TaxID=103827 RepID=A0A0N5CJN4_THECL|nr:unnamed protein product [Thelazia callipaeda]
MIKLKKLLTQDGRADMTNFEMDLFDTRMNSYTLEKVVKSFNFIKHVYICTDESEQCCQHSIIKPACVPISVISLFIFLIVFLPLFSEDNFDNTSMRYVRSGCCTDQCRVQFVESIPSVLAFNSSIRNLETYDVWKSLLDETRTSIDIASLYWNLRDPEALPASREVGNDTFARFLVAAKRGVRVSFLFSFINLFIVNMSKLFGTNGILHTKFWIADSRHVYIGSANMDWKSLTMVKEFGVIIWNCTCIANDLYKIFNVYWRLGVDGAIVPHKWPLNLRTYFNFSHPLKLSNVGDTGVFISSSPPEFNAKGREEDGNAIVAVMGDAENFVHISVMDYMPVTLYMTNNTYWPKLDDAIRSTAYRGVKIRLLVGYWKYSKPEMISFLKSLLEINSGIPSRANHSGKIEVKMFAFPTNSSPEEFSYTYVNHCKYMVTEKIAYIGTSNWVGDYFLNTAGVGVSFISPSFAKSLNEVFMRDWNSVYAKNVRDFLLTKHS